MLSPNGRGFGLYIASLYDRTGFLVLLSVVALVAGWLLQTSFDLLPSSYTWLQPYRTLIEVVELNGLPTAMLGAFLVGFFTRHRWRWRSALDTLSSPTRAWQLGRLLAFWLAFAIDVLYFPRHGALDAIALGALFALLTTRRDSKELLQLSVSALTGVLVFSAVCYWFTVIKALTFLDREPLDGALIAFESLFFGEPPHRLVANWSREQPLAVEWFDWAYFRLFHHMALTLAVLLGLGDAVRRARYVAALAICYFLGGPLYLLFPALGPVYFDPPAFDFLIHSNLLTHTMQDVLWVNTVAVGRGEASILPTWGYIACMPSLHMAHEFVMLVAVRPSRVAFTVSLSFTVLTALAVVALGWHYPTDIFAGFLLGLFAWRVAPLLGNQLLPALSGVPQRAVREAM